MSTTNFTERMAGPGKNIPVPTRVPRLASRFNFAILAAVLKTVVPVVAALGLAALFPSAAQAADKYWRTDGTTGGNWTSTYWNTDSPNATGGTGWTAGDIAFFTANSTLTFATATVGNVNVSASVTVTVTAGGTLTLGGVRTFDIGSGGTLTWTSQTQSTAAGNEGAGIIKNGTGTLDWGAGPGSNVRFNGGCTLNAGTIIVSGDSAFGTNTLTLNGGTLQSSGTRAFTPQSIVVGGDFTLAGTGNANWDAATTISLGAATRTITHNATGSRQFRGLISGASGVGITFTGTGTGQVYIGNTGNTFDGPIAITGSEVVFNDNGALGASTSITLDGGRMSVASMNTGGSTSALTAAAIDASRNIFVGDTAGTAISIIGGTGVTTYNGVIADKPTKTGAWAKQGAGRLDLGGVSTYSGDTSINNGTVRLTTGNNRLPTTTTVNLGQASSANLGTLDLNGNNQEIAGLTSTAGSNSGASKNTVTSTGAATLTLSGDDSYTFGAGTAANSGVIGGAISLVKSGTGTQTLGDTNTFSGNTTISAGTLALSGGGCFTNTPNITIAGGATFDVSVRTTALTLRSSQTLKASGNGSSGTIATTTDKGLTLGNTGGLQFTAYDGTTSPLTVTGGGSVTLASGNVVTVTVSGSAALGAGDYKLIAKGTGNTTAANGAAPSSVTVDGAGVVAAATVSLVITGGELFLHVELPANSTQSDIIRAAGFTEPANIDYASYQTASGLTTGNSIEMARFTLRDGGASSPDSDSVGTTLTNLSFTVANGSHLRRVALFAGSTAIAEVAGGTTVTFANLSGLIAPDDGTTNFSVRATFNSTVTDNQQLQFTVSSATADGSGSTFAAANAGGAASDTSGDANRIEVTAAILVFSSVPLGTPVNQNFSVTVQARDANENIDLDDTTSVTITKASGSGTLAGGAAQDLVNGARTWSALQMDTEGTFTLEASGGSLTDATSANITAGKVTEIHFPQYIQGGLATNTKRVPYAFRAQLSGLKPNATYRFYNNVITNGDPATTDGAGNMIFVTESGSFTRFAGNYGLDTGRSFGTFTTDGSGQHTGWFGIEPTGNTRFATAGNQVFMRIMLNDGAGGTNVALRLTTADAVTVLAFNTSGANTGTGIRGTSYATDKNFVLLYDNTSGTGRPVSGTLVEADGAAETTANSYVGFYDSAVNEISGAWGTIIPNTLASGVRRIEQRAKSDGSLVAVDTDGDGIWPSTVDTTNPAGGDATPKVIAATDGPLNEPLTHASGVGFSSVTSISMTVSWTSGSGAKRIVVVRQGAATSFTPSDFAGISGTVSADYSAATDQGGGNKVCYDDTGSSFNLTGLSAYTTYYVTVFEYNGSGASANYLTSGSPAAGSQLTSCTVGASDVNLSRPTGTALKVAESVLLAGTSGSGTRTVSDVDALSDNGVSLTRSGGWVFYNGNLTANDSFQFTVSVPGGCTATALVYITATNSVGLSSPSITVNGGNVTTKFHGIPGYQYSVQRATNASFTGGISNFPSVTAPDSGQIGLISVTDDFSDLGFFPNSAFYRLNHTP